MVLKITLSEVAIAVQRWPRRAARALVCHAARSASQDRIFTHTARPPDLHDPLTRLRTERHINTSSWIRHTLKNALEREGMIIGAGATPLPGWRPQRLDNGDWGSIYLGDTVALPSELAGATIVV